MILGYVRLTCRWSLFDIFARVCGTCVLGSCFGESKWLLSPLDLNSVTLLQSNQPADQWVFCIRLCSPVWEYSSRPSPRSWPSRPGPWLHLWSQIHSCSVCLIIALPLFVLTDSCKAQLCFPCPSGASLRPFRRLSPAGSHPHSWVAQALLVAGLGSLT